MSQEQSLLNALDAAGIAWAITKHQAVYTVEESAQLHAEIPGAHTKNLFLKDAAEQFCVVSAPQHRDTGLSGDDLLAFAFIQDPCDETARSLHTNHFSLAGTVLGSVTVSS